MIALALSAVLVAAAPLAFAHGHALGVRRGQAETLDALEAEARRRLAGRGEA